MYAVSPLCYSKRKMLGSKGILTPLIPDCSALRAPAILKTFIIRSFFYENGYGFMFWRVPRSKILLQASLHRISDLLTLVSKKKDDSNVIEKEMERP